VRIAWCYYHLGLTQQEIAARLGINRIRVNRLLGEARRRGIVRISIDSKLAENAELEARLIDRYGLDLAEVMLTMTDDERATSELLGAAACQGIGGKLLDGMTIGVGWGVTLKSLAEAMPTTPLAQSAVVALVGSLSRRSSIDRYEATTTLAGKLDAECFYMPGPLFCDSEAARDALIMQPMVQEVLSRARACDIAIASIGGLDWNTMRRVELVSDEEIAAVREAGAVGNYLGHFIDAGGEVLDHPLNRRVIGLVPHELAGVPQRIMISGGRSKIAALKAVLGAGVLTGLVTDQASARALLE
jgi:DNA-binding transcriptional regulator LsrR (DeoR family)